MAVRGGREPLARSRHEGACGGIVWIPEGVP